MQDDRRGWELHGPARALLGILPRARHPAQRCLQDHLPDQTVLRGHKPVVLLSVGRGTFPNADSTFGIYLAESNVRFYYVSDPIRSDRHFQTPSYPVAHQLPLIHHPLTEYADIHEIGFFPFFSLPLVMNTCLAISCYLSATVLSIIYHSVTLNETQKSETIMLYFRRCTLEFRIKSFAMLNIRHFKLLTHC